MAGFVRFVSVQKYVSVQMVIADYGGATPTYGPYTSGSQISRSNFPGYPNGFTGGVPLSRPQFYPNGYGYTGGVPLSRPNGYVYTEVWQEEDISEEVDDVQVKKGDSESHVLQKCCKFLADCFHQFYVNFKEFLYDFKQFLADWFREFYDNFKEFLYDFKQFLYNLEHYIDRSTVFLEHCAEFMDRLSRIMKEWNDMENLANNGTQAGDSYHCYHYYNNNYNNNNNNNNNNSGCCPCIGFRRGGAPSLSNGVNQRGVRREEEVVQKCCEGYKNSGCFPCSGFRIRRGASSLSNGDNHPGVRQEEVVQKCCEGCRLCNPPTANKANNGRDSYQGGDSYHCYDMVYYNCGCCRCIGFRIQRGGAPSPSNDVNHQGVWREEVVQKCCEWCRLCNPPRADEANNGRDSYEGGDSYHCYDMVYYNRIYKNSGCCPCIGFQIRRGGAPSPSNGGNHQGVWREEAVQKCCKLCNPPTAEAN